MDSFRENQPGLGTATSRKELIFHIVLTVSSFLSIAFVPFVGLLFGVLSPAPTVIAFLRYGAPKALLVPAYSGLIGAIILLWLGMGHSIPYFLAFLGMGVMLGHGIRKEWPVERIIGLSALTVIGLACLLLIASYLETDGAIVPLLERDLKDAISDAARQLGPESLEKQALTDALTAMVPTIVRIIPGITVSSTLGIAWLNLLIA